MAHVVQQQHAGDALGEVGDLDGQGRQRDRVGDDCDPPGDHPHSAGSARNLDMRRDLPDRGPPVPRRGVVGVAARAVGDPRVGLAAIAALAAASDPARYTREAESDPAKHAKPAAPLLTSTNAGPRPVFKARSVDPQSPQSLRGLAI
jgi:hypothetical protein